jgi:hypothetical protein
MPFLYIDQKTQYTKLITHPTVVVTIDSGKPRFRLSFLRLDDVIRSGSYEHKEETP